MPVFNQEDIIVTNLQSIFTNTIGTFELILIFDGCLDQSESKALTFLKSMKAEQCFRILCYRAFPSIFETSSDNLGFKACRGQYWIEIQADMTIMTFGYNFLLSRPCRIWPEVFAVSGRCCHQWKNSKIGCGKLGANVEHALKLDFEHMNKFYTAETCNRGPLLFVGERLKALDYLDEKNFVLGDDDHDIMARAYTKYGWINGYVPIEVYSPLAKGSTRKPRDPLNSQILEKRRRESDGGFLQKWVTSSNYKSRNLEVRDIPAFHPPLLPLDNSNKMSSFHTDSNKGISFQSDSNKGISQVSDRIVIVTAASANHAHTLQNLVENLSQYKENNILVVVYDLGLLKDQRVSLEAVIEKYPLRFCLETFDYLKFPAHCNIKVNAGYYAWKPNIVYEVCQRYKGLVLWMDSGNLVHKPLVLLHDIIKIEGIYTNESSGDISKWTHPSTIAFLKCPKTNLTNRNAACIGFNYDKAWVREFVNEWKSYACIKDCIAPVGSSWKNHRYDQSILTILYYKYRNVHQFKDDYLRSHWKYHIDGEYSIHNDVETEPAWKTNGAPRLPELMKLNDRLKIEHKDVKDTKEINDVKETPQGLYTPQDCLKAINFWKYKNNTWSQFGEDGIIAHLLQRLKIDEGWVCEFGAADGKWNSNTFKLVETKKFQAVYIEADEIKYRGLYNLTKKYPNITPMYRRVSPVKDHPDSLDVILAATKCEHEFALLSVDIDSCDYQVWSNLSNYRPKIVIIEINSSISPYDETFFHGNNGVEGTGYLPMVKLGLAKGYRLVCHTGNLIWVREDFAHLVDLCPIDPVTSPECYVCTDWFDAAQKQFFEKKQQVLREAAV
jgi:hypothetical protein